MFPFGLPPPGYRLPDATRLGPVRLQVADLERSLGFYGEVLGLRSIVTAPAAAGLGPHGEDRVLVWLHERPGAKPVPRRGVLGLFHFAILLPDRMALGRFLHHLTALGAYMGMADHAVSEALYLYDPDGLGIEVYADRPRSTWRHTARQLYMTTEPLDVQSVLAEGRGSTWQGMPPGTVMGHVHLHVGDLDEGAGFYHLGLGFDKVVWDYPGALFMSAGGYHHHLGTNTWASGPPAVEDQARLISWEVVLPMASDVSAAAESLRSRDCPIIAAAGESVTADDPWGTTVRLVPASPS